MTWLRFVFAGVTNRVLSSHGAKSMVWSRPRAELLSVAWVVFPDRSWRRRMVPSWHPLSALDRQDPDIGGHDLQEGLLPCFASMVCGVHHILSRRLEFFGAAIERKLRIATTASPSARTCAPAFPGPARRCCHHVAPGSGYGSKGRRSNQDRAKKRMQAVIAVGLVVHQRHSVVGISNFPCTAPQS